MGSGQIFILCIVLIVFGSGLVRHYWRAQEHKPREDPHTESRIQALEQRVRTLESIVTDKGYDLKREFDKL